MSYTDLHTDTNSLDKPLTSQEETALLHILVASIQKSKGMKIIAANFRSEAARFDSTLR